jgi:7,8-dihydropterin-6-yl-methyl-4-(beta-D-ribofuranosyl)aminobenzene 5'-phosphate synthase
MIRITAIVENTAAGRGILAEHGLSWWIETDTHRVLFDTGQTPKVLAHNAARLNIDLTTADTVVLSHGHYDHTGGLLNVLQQADHPRLLLHPAAIERRYSRHQDGSAHDAGMPFEVSKRSLEQQANVTWTNSPTEVVPGLTVTGEVPRTTAYEDTGGAFYWDEACTQTDPIADDQAIFFDTPSGLVVVLGCAHAGVINTMRYVQRLRDNRCIHAVIGGMHLLHASPDRMEKTIAALRDFDVGLIAPTHCTGARAAAQLFAAFPDRWQPCPAGTRFDFESVNDP